MAQAAKDYTIGQLAREASYAVQPVHYYEDTGLMPHPPRTDGGQRRYGLDHLERLLFIRHARDLGFGVEDIRSLLELSAQPERSCQEVDAITRRHLTSIEDKLARLTALRAELRRMLRQCAKGRIADCKVIDALTSHEACKHRTAAGQRGSTKSRPQALLQKRLAKREPSRIRRATYDAS
jgi:DNA-binding transcriptional MerR regulator